MTKQNIIIGAIAVIALLLGGWAKLTPSQTIVKTSFGNTSIDGSQSSLPNPSNFDYLVARLGLGLGTNTSNSNTGVGNVNIEAQRALLTSATSTPCAILNPFNATSTILSFYYNITTATSSAMVYAVGTSTTQYATTTTMETASLGANLTSTITWDAGVNNSVVGPGQYIVAGATTGSPSATFTTGIITGGACGAVFQSAN